jgi:hypothetical protein
VKHDDLERMLADESAITPSAGFLTSVMEAVEREAAAPPPLEFPWFRALPGLLATAAAIIAAVWHGIGSLRDPVSLAAFDEQVRQLTALAAAMGLHWLLLAMAITIVSVMLPLGLLRSPS